MKLKSIAKSGFTLVEVLVVIAIIGILMRIIIGNLGAYRSQSRDARRKADIEQVRSALEIYRSQNGYYPNSGGWVNLSTLSSTLDTNYIAQIPVDPQYISGGTHLPYGYIGTSCMGAVPVKCYSYCLEVQLEISSATVNQCLPQTLEANYNYGARHP